MSMSPPECEPSFQPRLDQQRLISCSDSTASPEGKDGIVVLIPVGHLLPTPEGDAVRTPNGEVQDWPTLVNKARDQVIYTMESRLGITGLKDKILWEEVNTPLTCKSPFDKVSESLC